MRVLFVWPIVRMSIWDVATGHRQALGRVLGEENIRDFYLDARTAHHQRAVPEELRTDRAVLSKLATETVLCEALYFKADVVFIIGGLNFHAAGLWLLEQARIPHVVLFTESPYEDKYQREWASSSHSLRVITTDESSAEQYDWDYVPHAYNPSVHAPGPVDPEQPMHDVVFVGSGWPERRVQLEAVNWTGIDLGLYGIWPDVVEGSKLFPFCHQGDVANAQTAALYRNAKICLNIHRWAPTARSMGPRCYETAATGAFQLSDSRPDLTHVFGESVPTFGSSADLERKIRFFLEHEPERRFLASTALARVASHTFDARAPLVLDILERAAHTVKETV